MARSNGASSMPCDEDGGTAQNQSSLLSEDEVIFRQGAADLHKHLRVLLEAGTVCHAEWLRVELVQSRKSAALFADALIVQSPGELVHVKVA